MYLTQLGSGKSLNRFKKVANHIIEINRRYKRLSLKKQKDLGHSYVNQQQDSGFNTSEIYGEGVTNLAGNTYSLVRKKAAEKLGDKTVSGMEETARTGGNAVVGLANWILDHPGSSIKATKINAKNGNAKDQQNHQKSCFSE